MKSKTVQRLLVYLLLSFGLVWIPTFLFQAKGGVYDSWAMQVLMTFAMLCPSIAMLLTRWITKEGVSMKGENSLKLGISFKNRKWIWYVAAVTLPLIYNELGFRLFYLFSPESRDVGMLAEIGISQSCLWMYPIMVVTSTVMVSFAALGEEAGWRGYMMPKLEELFGSGWAILIGGVIWGVWHFPINTMGHNFGTEDYFGAPWSGYLIFTLFTIFVGAILTYLTKKSGSVWPAAFLHAVNNGGGAISMLYYNPEKTTGILGEPPIAMMIRMIPVIIIGAVAIYLVCRSEGSVPKAKGAS